MESWQSGRRDLFEELTRVCDRIETSLSNELDHDNSILIAQDELVALRDKASRVDKLEYEISTLLRQTEAQKAKEAKVIDGRLAYKENVEIRRLVENNTRLVAELETHKNTSLRAGVLTKDNERLAAELKQARQPMQEAQPTEKSAAEKRVGGHDFKCNPELLGPHSSARRVECDESQMVAKELYQSLVKKFNQVYEKWTDAKASRDKLSQAFGEERAKVKRYEQYCKIEDREKAQRDEKIQRQNEEIQRLRARVLEVDGRSKIQGTSIERSAEQREAQNLEEVARALNSASLGPIHYGGKVINFEDLVQALESPTLDSILAASRRIQELQSSPLRQSQLELVDHPALSTLSGFSETGEAAAASSRSNQNDDKLNASSELPMLLLGGHSPSGANVDDAEFEILEVHHASSTDEDTDGVSPDHATDDGVKQELSADSHLSPETPVVISSRSVRKVKRRLDTAPISTSKIKVETISSSPLGLAAFQTLDESIDLDEIGEKQVTPRKGRPFLQPALWTSSCQKNAAQRRQSQDHSHRNNLTMLGQVLQITPVRRPGASRNRSALQPLSSNKQIMPRTSEDRSPKRRRIASDKAVEELIEDGEYALPAEKSSRKKTTPEIANRLGNLLAKASPPKPILNPARLTNLVQTEPRHAKGSAVSSRAHEVLQQDPSNDDQLLFRFPQTSPTWDIPRLTPQRPVEASRPLSKGSSRGSADPSRLLSRGTIQNSAYGSRPPSRDLPTGPTELPRPSKGAFRASADLSRPSRDSTEQSLEHRPPSSSKGIARKQALRSRPLPELTLHDFKINPNYNQGYNYAYSEVVRNKADRQCLQGCTKPECCGRTFRNFAEALRDPNKPLTMSQEDADDRLVNEFLGDNRYKVRNMTNAERDETLLQARTREMANKHGRHRHAYERSRTPPGFWRSDFPTTQEDIEDRAKAEQQEREDVGRRHEEAMRQGGRYIFRDE